jgi:group I intron endonuclease
MKKIQNTIVDISSISCNKDIENALIGIYKITSPSNKVYIGQSNDLYSRFYIYKKLHCKKQIYLYNSLLKYGIENHKFEIIHICKEEELNYLEIYYSNIYKSTDREFGLNLRECGGANGKHSEESKLKMRLSSLGKKKSKESRLKMSLSKKGVKPFITGKHHSKESILKMSLSKIGKPSKLRGINLSDECKKKISESLKGKTPWNKGKKMTEAQTINMKKPMSEQAKINMRLSKLGKKQSPEHIKKRISGRKIFMTDETKKKLSEMAKLRLSNKKNTFFGKKHSEATKKIMSDVRKLYWENIKNK